MNYKVFISHGSGKEDTHWANQIRDKLSENNIDSFLDHHDVGIGNSFRTKILTELQSCDELLCLLTPDSISRPWIAAEIGAAFVLEKNIVPVTVYMRDEELQTGGFLSILDNVSTVSFPDLMNDFDSYVKDIQDRKKDKENA